MIASLKRFLTSRNTSVISTPTGGFMFCLKLPFMPLTENLEKKSCKTPNLLLLLEPQCFTAAVVSPSPAVSARGVGWMESHIE